MARSLPCLALAALLMPGTLFSVSTARAQESGSTVKKPRVEVVFCVDTTGSMGGLIEGAKQKIWSISNQIAGGKPGPDLRVGLVAYRDRGDQYITQITDLTDDLDAIHQKLKGFRAQGGGDGPESVNQALADSLDKIKWSAEKDVLRIIFLVGDAPPHMDYAEDVKYPETCRKAAERGIIINTVQCGNNAETRKYWQEICSKAEGSYVQIPQDGGVVAMATPFDGRLAEINTELTRSTLTFGTTRVQALGESKKAEALSLAPAAAADRAGFNSKAGRAATFDLLDCIKAGQVKLEELKKEELPPELKDLSLVQQKEQLEKIDRRRQELNRETTELDRKRSEFIQKKLTETAKPGVSAFDQQVLEMLQKQAKKHNIAY